MTFILQAPFQEERLLKSLQSVAWAVVLGVFCFVGLLFFQGAQQEEWRAEIPAESGDRRFIYEKIGSGPLALSGSNLSPLFAALTREIVLLGKNSRPDAQADGAQIALRLASSGEERRVKMGVPVFLDMRLGGNGTMESLKFSNEPTPIWIALRDLDAQSIAVDVGESPLFADVEKRQFTIKMAEGSGQLENQIAYATLKNGRLLGQDLFYLYQGGEAYQGMAKKQKIELVGLSAPYALYVEPGDLLFWKEDKWHVGADAEATVAKVQGFDGSGMMFQVWNASGFESAQVKMDKRKSETSLSMEKYLENVRIRTATQVTGLLGGKRVIIKKGDWLLKTKNGWRNLRTVGDIQGYLKGDLVGQLFVFDSIEIAVDGLPVMLGRLYDESRTNLQGVTLAINQDKLGPYTVGAILSFAFHQKAVAVDGNVARVLARLLLIEEEIDRPKVQKQLREQLFNLLPDSKPWVIMEGLIELGARVCTKKPRCEECPLQDQCLAYRASMEEKLPLKSKQPQTTLLKRRVAVICFENQLLLRQEKEKRVMHGLYQFPFLEGENSDIAGAFGLDLQFERELPRVEHTFTRYRAQLFPAVWRAHSYRELEGYEWVERERLNKLAFCSGHREILYAHLTH